jgi:hypothetical protein
MIHLKMACIWPKLRTKVIESLRCSMNKFCERFLTSSETLHHNTSLSSISLLVLPAPCGGPVDLPAPCWRVLSNFACKLLHTGNTSQEFVYDYIFVTFGVHFFPMYSVERNVMMCMTPTLSTVGSICSWHCHLHTIAALPWAWYLTPWLW